MGPSFPTPLFKPDLRVTNIYNPTAGLVALMRRCLIMLHHPMSPSSLTPLHTPATWRLIFGSYLLGLKIIIFSISSKSTQLLFLLNPRHQRNLCNFSSFQNSQYFVSCYYLVASSWIENQYYRQYFPRKLRGDIDLLYCRRSSHQMATEGVFAGACVSCGTSVYTKGTSLSLGATRGICCAGCIASGMYLVKTYGTEIRGAASNSNSVEKPQSQQEYPSNREHLS